MTETDRRHQQLNLGHAPTLQNPARHTDSWGRFTRQHPRGGTAGGLALGCIPGGAETPGAPRSRDRAAGHGCRDAGCARAGRGLLTTTGALLGTSGLRSHKPRLQAAPTPPCLELPSHWSFMGLARPTSVTMGTKSFSRFQTAIVQFPSPAPQADGHLQGQADQLTLQTSSANIY